MPDSHYGPLYRPPLCLEAYRRDEQAERDAELGRKVREALENYQRGPVGIRGLRHWAGGLHRSRKPLAAHVLHAIADALEAEEADSTKPAEHTGVQEARG